MALNLFGNGYGNQNYSPAQTSGQVTTLVQKYGKPELKRTITTTSSGKPKTVTKTRTIEQPKMEYATYQGSEETEATIPTKAIFGTTPQQRKQYVREIEDYNRQVRAEKKKVEDYNKEVKEWNEKGRFQTVRETYTYTPTTTKTSTLTIPTKQSEQQTKETTTKSVVSKTPFERLSVISPQPNYLEKKEDKPTFTSELKSQATQRYLPIPKYIISGFGKFGEAISKKDVTVVSEPLSKSVEDFKSGTKQVPGVLYAGGKSFVTTAIETQPFRKDYVSGLYSSTRAFREELKTPQRQAELVLTGGELVLPYAVSKVPQAYTTAKYRLFGTKVAPETLYSPIAMKSPRGLDLTYNPEKTVAKFKTTFGKTKELPGQFVGVSQSRATDLGSKVLTRSELKAIGIPQGSEPGLFVSPKGAGQTGFLGISDDVSYKLTADPRKLFSQGQPTTFQIGFKDIGQYPKSILKAPLKQSQLEAYQISQAPKSKALITRMSSLGTKLEPEVIIPVTSKLEKIKTPLYYTEFKGTVVPIKTISVAGTGAKTKNLISQASVFKGTKAYESLAKGERYFTISPSLILPSYKSTSSSLSSSKLQVPSFSSLIKKQPEPIISTISKPETKLTSTTTSKSQTTGESSFTRLMTSSPTPAPQPSTTAPSRPRLTPKYTSGTGRFITRPVIAKDRKAKETVTGEPAYDVLIKVGNKWVNRTNGKRNVYSAIHRGTELVDNTTAKSFKIKKGTGKANILKYNMPYNINKFYTPSKTRSAKLTGAYIEKSRFAIDTPGERKGLSVAKYLRGVKLI